MIGGLMMAFGQGRSPSVGEETETNPSRIQIATSYRVCGTLTRESVEKHGKF
jgi:hypothetical protein